jgi:hypothetical protein
MLLPTLGYRVKSKNLFFEGRPTCPIEWTHNEENRAHVFSHVDAFFGRVATKNGRISRKNVENEKALY